MLSFLISLVVAVSVGNCWTIEDGWKGIKPLLTNRTAVEKTLGRGEIDDNGYVTYVTEEASIQVNYSAPPCIQNQYERGKYRVPENTVLDYQLHFRQFVKLSELEWEKVRYKKDTSGDVESLAVYRDQKHGISIYVSVQGGVEYVGRIVYRPSEEQEKASRCTDK